MATRSVATSAASYTMTVARSMPTLTLLLQPKLAQLRKQHHQILVISADLSLSRMLSHNPSPTEEASMPHLRQALSERGPAMSLRNRDLVTSLLKVTTWLKLKALLCMRSAKVLGTVAVISRIQASSPRARTWQPKLLQTAIRHPRLRGRLQAEEMALQPSHRKEHRKTATIFSRQRTARRCPGVLVPRKVWLFSTCAYSRLSDAQRKRATTRRSASTTTIRTRGAPWVPTRPRCASSLKLDAARTATCAPRRTTVSSHSITLRSTRPSSVTNGRTMSTHATLATFALLLIARMSYQSIYCTAWSKTLTSTCSTSRRCGAPSTTR